MSKANDWIYIYYVRDNLIIFDRSVSRKGLGPLRAQEVVKGFRDRNVEAFYTVGAVIPGALT